MREVNQKIYLFEELSDEAKAVAISAWRNNMEFLWTDEGIDSIKAFCDKFNVELLRYQVGPYEPVQYRTDATNVNFRGVKLKDIDPEESLTGYFIDSELLMTFCEHFGKTGDALAAFDAAINAGFIAIRTDMENQMEDDYIADTIEANQYEFYPNGKMYT